MIRLKYTGVEMVWTLKLIMHFHLTFDGVRFGQHCYVHSSFLMVLVGALLGGHYNS